MKLVESPRRNGPKHTCNSGYYCDSDLLICIREEITPSRLKEDVNLGTRFNRLVVKLRGK